VILSRYIVKVVNGDETDHEAIIGFDPPLGTFFLQAFPKSVTDECAVWLGNCVEEYPTLDSLIQEARARGFEIQGLTRKLILALLREAAPRLPTGLGKSLGKER
jgi:hypothetical protein